MASDEPVLTLHVNSLTLAANSEVLRRKLEEWSDGDSRELHLEVTPGEERTLEALVRFCYTKQIPFNRDKDVLRLMQLADRFLMEDCVRRCATLLNQIPHDLLSLETCYRFLRLPAGLYGHKPFSRLMQRGLARLVEEFGDLDEVWTDEERQAAFLAMPLEALQILLSTPLLRVTTENTVFVAVSHWMHNAMSQSLLDDAEDAALKLGMHIRLPMLSNDFLHFVAMEATWLPQDLKYGPQFRAATRFKGAHADLKAQLRSDDRPEALAYQPRPQGTGSSQGIMDWKVPIMRVGRMRRQGEGSSVRVAPEHYLCGYYWYLITQYNSGGTSLGCYLHWTTKLSSSSEMSPPEAFVRASISLSLRNERSGEEYVHVASMTREQNFGGGLGMGWGNPFKVDLPTESNEADLTRLLDQAGWVVDGFLHVRFTVDVKLDE